MTNPLLTRERELLDRLSNAILKGRDIEKARKALNDFYRTVGMAQ